MPNMQEQRVLVVEDDAVLANLLSTQFENQGIGFIAAPTGEAALQFLNADPNFGAILLDISLPEKDGFEVLSAIKKDSRTAHIPVIIISNFSQEEDLVWGKKLGAAHFVSKASMVPADIVSLTREVMSNPPAAPAADQSQRMRLMPDA